jgi:hypothetical protein
MKIEISDNETPEERAYLLKVLPVVHAFKVCPNQKLAAEFLDLAPKTFRKRLREYKERMKLEGTTKEITRMRETDYMTAKTPEELAKYEEMLSKYPDD